jgi:uncharacterized protein
MKAKIIHEGTNGVTPSERTFALIFDKGDEVISGLTAFAKDRSLSACHLTAIGAFSDLTVGFFDWETKDYTKIPIREQVEVLSLVGTAHGGHLMEAHVRPTLEVILVESPSFLQRTHDPDSGLALIDVGAGPKAASPA